MRHSFATDLLEAGYANPNGTELTGHRDVSTTMIYTHVLNRGHLWDLESGRQAQPVNGGSNSAIPCQE
jgi:site-specific recombinase XerD